MLFSASPQAPALADLWQVVPARIHAQPYKIPEHGHPKYQALYISGRAARSFSLVILFSII